MNIRVCIYAIAILTMFSSCSKDDDPSNTIIKATSISIIKEDGTFISVFDCVNPSEKYSVLIKVEGEGSGTVKESVVPYTINGELYSMTFDRLEDQQNQINLIEGENVVQLVETGFVAKVSYIAQDDFELVE